MKNILILTSILIISNYSFAQDLSVFFSKADSFLAKNVKDGQVAYSVIRENPQGLNELMSLAERVSVSTKESKEYQAFWINAYNLAVIKGIMDNYPIKSPLDKNGFFDKITYKLGGFNITLNDIENKMLRKEFADARFHFVLVCGAKGCPPLIAEAYKPELLDTQLDTQTKKSLNNPNFIKIDDNKVQLSEIFKWYKEDFVKAGNEIDFINTYRKDKIASSNKIAYYTYDWRLNKQ